MPFFKVGVDVPGPSFRHLIADYCEIEAIKSADGRYDASALEQRRVEQRELGRRRPASVKALVQDLAAGEKAEVGEGEPAAAGLEIDWDLLESLLDEDAEANVQEAVAESEPAEELDPAAEDDESRERLAQETRVSADAGDIFGVLRWRSRVYGVWYPFEIDEDELVIRVVPRLTSHQQMYLFLAARVRSGPPRRRKGSIPPNEGVRAHVSGRASSVAGLSSTGQSLRHRS
jgi:hypothetical protein